MGPTSLDRFTGWIMRRPDSLTTEEAATLEPVACRSAVLARTAALVAGLAQMMLSRHGDQLKTWLTTIETAVDPAPSDVLAPSVCDETTLGSYRG